MATTTYGAAEAPVNTTPDHIVLRHAAALAVTPARIRAALAQLDTRGSVAAENCLLIAALALGMLGMLDGAVLMVETIFPHWRHGQPLRNR